MLEPASEEEEGEPELFLKRPPHRLGEECALARLARRPPRCCCSSCCCGPAATPTTTAAAEGRESLGGRGVVLRLGEGGVRPLRPMRQRGLEEHLRRFLLAEKMGNSHQRSEHTARETAQSSPIKMPSNGCRDSATRCRHSSRCSRQTLQHGERIAARLRKLPWWLELLVGAKIATEQTGWQQQGSGIQSLEYDRSCGAPLTCAPCRGGPANPRPRRACAACGDGGVGGGKKKSGRARRSSEPLQQW